MTVNGGDGQTFHGFANTGAYFAFFILPTILFFSALTAIAYHSGIMQYVVQLGQVARDKLLRRIR